MAKKRPFVTIKIAQTFDGKIAAVGGKSRWITGPEARNFVHLLRERHDAILVGKNTFQIDRPRLYGTTKSSPGWKIILSSPELLPLRRPRVFEPDVQVVFVVAKKDLSLWMNHPSLKKRECLFLIVKKSQKGFDLKDLLSKLGALGIRKLLVEGGGEVFWSFLNQKLADEIYWMMAPKVLGGRDARTAVEGDGIRDPNAAIGLKVNRVIKLGRDYCFKATLNKDKRQTT